MGLLLMNVQIQDNRLVWTVSVFAREHKKMVSKILPQMLDLLNTYLCTLYYYAWVNVLLFFVVACVSFCTALCAQRKLA